MYDFGIARANAVIHHSFLLRNPTDLSVEVAEVGTSCGCTATQDIRGEVIEPKGVLPFPVRLHLSGRSGRVNELIRVRWVNEREPRLFRITGVVKEEHPSRIDFGTVPRGEGRVHRFTMEGFPGQPVLEILKVSHLTAFQVDYGEIGGSAGAQEFTIQLRESTAYGLVAENLWVTTNDSEVPVKQIALSAYVQYPFDVSKSRIFLGVLPEGDRRSDIIEVTSPYGYDLSGMRVIDPEATIFASELERLSDAARLRVLARAEPGRTGAQRGVFRILSEVPGAEAEVRVEAYAFVK
ncbi:MAG: DUF1573 domain-containing protein [Candidatus Hydrogenedentes bacterium]|nr:DUF1573 domain-containing protein [Candidatus Hydrogenedentota bacterium]